MNQLEEELAKHGRWDIRRPDEAGPGSFEAEGTWWACREYDKRAGRGATLLDALRAANTPKQGET